MSEATVVNEMVSATTKAVKPTTGWGRGWHLKKEFIAPDGKKYSKGVLISEGK